MCADHTQEPVRVDGAQPDHAVTRPRHHRACPHSTHGFLECLSGLLLEGCESYTFVDGADCVDGFRVAEEAVLDLSEIRVFEDIKHTVSRATHHLLAWVIRVIRVTSRLDRPIGP